MGLETGNFITDLEPANPIGTDIKSFGDDHIRLLKKTVQQSFPNINAPILWTPEDFALFAPTSGGTVNTNITITGTNPSLAINRDTTASNSEVHWNTNNIRDWTIRSLAGSERELQILNGNDEVVLEFLQNKDVVIGNAVLSSSPILTVIDIARGDFLLRSTDDNARVRLQVTTNGQLRDFIILGSGATPSVITYFNDKKATETIIDGLTFGELGGLDVKSDATQSILQSTVPSFYIDNRTVTGLIYLRCEDGAGVERNGIVIGGTLMTVKLYANIELEAQTVQGAFDVINQITIGGNPEYLTDAHLDWVNFGKSFSSTVKAGSTISTTAVTTTDTIIVRVPQNADTLRYAPEMSCDRDDSRVTYMRLDSNNNTGTACSQIGFTLATFPTNDVQEGTLDVRNKRGLLIRLDLKQWNNNVSNGNQIGEVYNVTFNFE